ncbi:MAG: ABC-2 family transporter protein [Opitutaceae bacterium]|nr:ABC-2 family transporter protein [Opitutaceae bacterium]
MKITRYLRLWAACARYSVIRMMMFRLDFTMWALVELFWMGVNVALVSVIYLHTESIAGWSKYEMLLLVGSSMLTQRILMGLFWSNLFELGKNVRSGNFDFFVAQPGNLLFMASTRKLDLDSLANSLVAIGIVVYAAKQLALTPSVGDIALYALTILSAVVIHYSILVCVVSLTFWIIKTEGVEGSYFTLTEFSRLPKEAFGGILKVIFVWLLPVVVMSNVPARVLRDGFQWQGFAWLIGCAVVWFLFAVWLFHRGVRRYSSASS